METPDVAVYENHEFQAPAPAAEELPATETAMVADDLDDAEDGQSSGGEDEVAVVPVRPLRATPERIRARAARLYGEMHELIDRQRTRSERQRDIARRSSSHGGSIAGADGNQRRDSSAAAAARAEAAPRLPNLYRTFEEARRRHLDEARGARTFFPAALEPTEYSEKDPDTFSLRFQTARLGN